MLESRGLIVTDRSRAEHYLANISYYRLSAYTLPFRIPNTDKFEKDVSFEMVLNLYLFDRKLRLLLFDAFERFEIAFRTQAIYQPAMACGPFWFEDEANFLEKWRVPEQLAKIDEEVNRSKEVFIQHFRTKYTSQPRPPAWMTFEVLSLGLVSKLCQNLNNYAIRAAIAGHFGFTATQRGIFESWLQSVVYVRNICAHHSRLWNRTLTVRPAVLSKSAHPWITDSKTLSNNKLYYFLCCTLFLLRRVNPDTTFVSRLNALLREYPDISLAAMGFPVGWESQDFWKQ